VTAHVSSLYVPFLTVGLSIGIPPTLAVLAFGYFSTLCGGLTHYSIGQAPVLYGMHYVELKDWWKLGAVLSLMYIIIWSVIGGLWWKWLGIW
jgi:DASS family divalent anion:Na+ symporter